MVDYVKVNKVPQNFMKGDNRVVYKKSSNPLHLFSQVLSKLWHFVEGEKASLHTKSKFSTSI